MSPLTWAALSTRAEMVKAYRGPAASALMKSLRLIRPEDALYWTGVLVRGRAGAGYVSRRVFRCAGEDNLDPGAMEVAEGVLTGRPTERELLWVAFAVTLGTKWYELPETRRYARARTVVGRQPHGKAPFLTADQLLDRYRRALDGETDVVPQLGTEGTAFQHALWWLAEAAALEVRLWRFFRPVIAMGVRAPDETTRRLAGVLERQHGWLAAVGETNHLKTLIWSLLHGPLPSAGRQATVAEFDQHLAAAEHRLEAEIEAVPSWARDGIHLRGRDPRFAGNWEGWLNMCSMFERDGALDPGRPGATLHADVLSMQVPARRRLR